MHELSLAQNIIEIVDDEVAWSGGGKVMEIVLEIGNQAAIEKDALLFSLEILVKESLHSSARVVIDSMEGEGLFVKSILLDENPGI